MRTRDVAEASGYSVQQVRDLEGLGVIPPAARTASGYRTFGAAHLEALRAYRLVARGAGPVTARRVLRDARTLPREDALAQVVELHAALAAARRRVDAARRALALVLDEEEAAASPVPGDSMGISELAGALGVRPSAMRFWEREGLISAERREPLGPRHYPPGAADEARIVAALREGGYGVPAVREVMASIRGAGSAEAARAALDSRVGDLTARAEALLEAGPLVLGLVTSTQEAGPQPSVLDE